MSSKVQNKLVIKLLEVIEERKTSITQFCEDTGIPKDRVYKWKQQGNNPKAVDVVKINEWINGEKKEKVPHGTDGTFVKDNTQYLVEVKYTLTDLLQEKEARRREAEERAKKAEETNQRLLALLETNLGNLAKEGRENTAAILSEIRGYGQQQIRMLVQYNDEEFAKAKQDADKIYLLNLRILLGDSMAGERKQDKHGKVEGA